MKQPEILLFESDGDARSHLASLLSERGYRVRPADSLAEGRPLAVKGEADLLITNLVLDDGTALELASSWTSTGRPALGISSVFRGPTSQALLVEQVGLSHVFEPPIDEAELIGYVERLLPDVPAAVAPLADDRSTTAKSALAYTTPLALDPKQAPVSGNLEDHDIAAVLSRLALDRVNGALMLVVEQIKKLVYFENGVPVGIKSNLIEECLGQMLVAEGIISSRACEDSVEERRRTGRPQGQVLVSMGAVTPEELDLAVERQFRYKFHQLFTWTSGFFRYRDATIPPAYYGSPLGDATDLIWQAVDRVRPVERARFWLDAVFTAPVQWTGAGLDISNLSVDDALRPLFGQLEGDCSPASIVSSSSDPDGALLLLYALTAFGLVAYLAEPDPSP